MRIDFQGRGNVEAFSRACVQAMGDGIELALRVARQVGTLGQVLAQQSIRVLVGAHVARGCTDRQKRSGWRAVSPGARAQPSLSPDHRSAFYAAEQAHAGVSS